MLSESFTPPEFPSSSSTSEEKLRFDPAFAQKAN